MVYWPNLADCFGGLMRFEGKVVVITGASSGIGAALAREFHREGARLVLLARRLERLTALKAELDPDDESVAIMECDVTRDGDLEEAMQKAKTEFGTLDIVVANAGFALRGSMDALELADYKRVFETNVFGVIRTLKAAIPYVVEAQGQLVVMGGVVAYFTLPKIAGYAMTKSAISTLAKSLHYELAPRGVTVTLLTPGFIVSEVQQVDNFGVHHPEKKPWLPLWLKMSTQRAAREMVHAVHRRRREAVISGHGKVLVFLARHAAWLVAFLLDLRTRWIARRLAASWQRR